MTNQGHVGAPAAADVREVVLDAVYRSLGEVDAAAVPGAAPDTVLLGDGGLDSLAFVTFVVALEEHLQRAGWTLSVIDLVLQEPNSATLGGLAERITAAVAGHGG